MGRAAYISERCEALTGLSASELRRDAMALLRRVDEPYRERVLASLRESERLQSQWQVEFRLLRLDGQMRWIRCHASARRGDGLNTPAEGGPTTTWHGYLEDVTDARRPNRRSSTRPRQGGQPRQDRFLEA